MNELFRQSSPIDVTGFMFVRPALSQPMKLNKKENTIAV